MISEQNYNKLLEEFGDKSSFAIYKESKNNDKATSENISFEEAIRNNQKAFINPSNIILMVNPSAKRKHSPDSNFSSFHHSNINDRHLRFLTMKSATFWRNLYGSYVTDLFPEVVESDMGNVLLSIKDDNEKDRRKRSYRELIKQLEILSQDSKEEKLNIYVCGALAKSKRKDFIFFIEELLEEVLEHSDFKIELNFYAVYHPGYQNLKKLIDGGCEKIIINSMSIK
jgi:hypothetical protein